MLNIFKDMATSLYSIAKDTVVIRSIDKADIQTLLRQNIDAHRQLARTLAIMSDQEMNSWWRTKVEPALRTSKLASKDVMVSYRKKLRGGANQAEDRRFLSSLQKANNTCGEILEQISKKVDVLMESERIDIYSVRMSHVGVLGILRQSDLLIKFSNILYAQLVRVSAHSTSLIPKYRDKFLVDNYSAVAETVSNILNKTGPYTFLQDADSARKKNADMILGFGKKFEFGSHAVVSAYSKGFLDNLTSALSLLNMFRWAGETWDNYIHERYLRDKETKEWLEQHTALLRMELDGVDKDTPIYRKSMEVITAYDEMIAQYETKISDYLGEE